ncbi:MAG: SAM-dependent methyltransferase [Nitrospirae bacterium]|nr:SAM-dependent methyltransferase [Nitrospirota bacterium]
MIYYKMPTPSENPLIHEIRNIIHAKGPIPFADFMDLALYHPRWGYYTMKRGKWGRRGDYATAPGISPVLGRLLATQCRQMWEILGCPSRFFVVEAGAGEGGLSLSLLIKAREDWPDFFDALTLIAVERGIEAFDREPFIREGLGEKILLRESLEDLPSGMEGVVLSNELIDAFPVHWMVFRKGELQEIHVGWEGDRFVPVPAPPSTGELAAYLKDAGVRPAEGQSLTINLEGSDTLLCYHRRMVSGDPFSHVGEQDITSHVDFSALMKAGEETDLRTLGLASQFYFFLGLGIESELRPGGPEGVTDPGDILWNQGIKELIHPGGMGGVFKALIQGKGIPENVRLDGLAFSLSDPLP